VDKSKRLSYEYYVLAAPTVSDAQFDALVSEIEQAEAEHSEWTLADSPTQMVGSDVQDNGRRLIRHRTRMLSCQKAQTQEAVTKWITATEKKLKGAQTYSLEWKYDGISCSLVYQDGQLTEASTRGEKGIMGQDILPHVAYIASVPHSINMTGRVEVRGEVVCPKTELASIGYKDCRTAAAALMNQMMPSQDCRKLVFLAWQMDCNNPDALLENKSVQMCRDMGFIAECRTCEGNAICGLLDQYEAERESLAYPTDGVVIKVNGKASAASLGATEHHPKGNIAYKFSAQKAVTRCIGIEICVGETGRRTPRALLEPVMIMGREVKAASMGSERVWHELGVTEGCLVEVGLSNDVTPKIYRVIDETDEPVQEVTTTDNTDKTDDAVIPEAQNEQSVYNTNAKLERLQQENERLQAQIAQMQAQQCAERFLRPVGSKRPEVERSCEDIPQPTPRPKRQRKPRKPVVEHQPSDISHQTSDSDHTWLRSAGYLAAASIALLVIWQTGLIIPLGLIGLATSGFIK